jgi:hypothetical protein
LGELHRLRTTQVAALLRLACAKLQLKAAGRDEAAAWTPRWRTSAAAAAGGRWGSGWRHEAPSRYSPRYAARTRGSASRALASPLIVISPESMT